MKHLAILFFFFSSIITSASIITVDNDTPGSDYSDLQAAIDAANSGDTIYVGGSNISYGSISIDKPIIIFGSGYDATISLKSQLGSIGLTSGADGTHISGFEFLNYSSSGIDINNLIISDCLITGIIYPVGNNNLIEGNIFSGSSIVISCQGNTGSIVTIRNNVIHGYINYLQSSQSIIKNNVFLKAATITFANSSGFAKVNNIYYGIPIQGCSGCTSSNEIEFYQNQTCGFQGQDPLFASVPTLTCSNSTTYNLANDFSLQAGSPAIGSGQNGEDIGAHGGPTPFVKGGFPPIPKITSMSVSTTEVQAGATIQVTIQAKSNN
jgi:hypothetical protein